MSPEALTPSRQTREAHNQNYEGKLAAKTLAGVRSCWDFCAWFPRTLDEGWYGGAS